MDASENDNNIKVVFAQQKWIIITFILSQKLKMV